MVGRRKSGNRIEKENRKKESEGNKNAENTERRWKLRGYEAGKVRGNGIWISEWGRRKIKVGSV
jgi:hypothetical protein